VELYQGKERKQVADWRRGENRSSWAVLIDDSLRSSIANQWNDLRSVSYGSAPLHLHWPSRTHATERLWWRRISPRIMRSPQRPFACRWAVAGPSPALTFALQDWMKRWPESPERKSILLFSSGINYFAEAPVIADPDLDSTIERAQKEKSISGQSMPATRGVVGAVRSALSMPNPT